MALRFAPIRCLRFSEGQRLWWRGAPGLIAAAAVLLVACEVSVPFNVLLLPFLPETSVRYAPNTQEVVVLPSEVAVPPFSLNQVPLNDVQIPLAVAPATGTGAITSATVEVGLDCRFVPYQESLSVEVETTLALYIAPATANDRFLPEYQVPLGRLQFGWSTTADLLEELSPDQLANLESEGLLVGIEFSDTYVSLSNTGGTTYEVDGIDLELTRLRIRGTVDSGSVGHFQTTAKRR